MKLHNKSAPITGVANVFRDPIRDRPRANRFRHISEILPGVLDLIAAYAPGRSGFANSAQRLLDRLAHAKKNAGAEWSLTFATLWGRGVRGSKQTAAS